MPELPEVETTCRGLLPFLQNQNIKTINVYQPKLRQVVAEKLVNYCQNQQIHTITRRGKYIIIHLTQGAILIHLGMTGHLRMLTSPTEKGKHDHIDVLLTNGCILRYHDPRRFGSWQLIEGAHELHPSLSNLGPEPLNSGFNGNYLIRFCRKKIGDLGWPYFGRN